MKCIQCNSPVIITGSSFCSHCGARIATPHEQDRSLSPAPFAWESAAHSSTPLRLFASTVAEALLHPDRFYMNVVQHSSHTLSAWIYSLMIGSIGIIASWAWSLLKTPSGSIFSFDSLLPGAGTVSASTLAAAPVILSLQLLLTVMYVFITLRLSNLQQPTFGRLFRILCYAESPILLQLIPFIGTVAAFLLWMYALLTALHHLYEGSRVKILFHLLMPFFLISALIMVIAIAGILGGIIAGAGCAQNWKFLPDMLK